ncbi:NAD(P)-dependent oxidoreductase [Roseomonas hellenica]|uniref:NAD(P)-dependent oxidoreductase n=1 Tax=Plastoroseomonas hellenica TaxID=2687306 RepID=A0ABS5EUB8_9PROT|nr:NAD(P)-dependent oxidoreductase [Plastoroseomonas hellenica]
MSAGTAPGEAKQVLLTGASGALGSMLAARLSEWGWGLVLTDIRPFPDALPPGARFREADLCDRAAIRDLAAGCDAIVHFGGVSTERAFEDVLGPNIGGLFNIFEAARLADARVIFASSNHAIGFHERSSALDADCELRPDTYYGLSKAYGELMGRLYWYKHGVESISVRIGSAFPKPSTARMLSSWLSYDDLARLVAAGLRATDVGCDVIWGASANSRTWWRKDARSRIGWAPQDSADVHAEALSGIVSKDPVEERYQGGHLCSRNYTRTRPPP